MKFEPHFYVVHNSLDSWTLSWRLEGGGGRQKETIEHIHAERQQTTEATVAVLPEIFLKLTPDFCQNTPYFPPDSKIIKSGVNCVLQTQFMPYIGLIGGF